MTTKIKVLKVNGVDGLKIHEIKKDGVTKIVDNSADMGYLIYVNGQLRYSYTNGVYEAEYYNDEEDIKKEITKAKGIIKEAIFDLHPYKCIEYKRYKEYKRCKNEYDFI